VTVSDDVVDRLRADIADLRNEMYRLGVDSATMRNKLDNLERDVSRLVPIDRYLLVERVVYGTVGLILVSFLGAIIALVVKQ
jgi:hypothetical protein